MNIFGCQFLFLVNVPKSSFPIFCLNKNVDLLNFQICEGVLQHPHCVRLGLYTKLYQINLASVLKHITLTSQNCIEHREWFLGMENIYNI